MPNHHFLVWKLQHLPLSLRRLNGVAPWHRSRIRRSAVGSLGFWGHPPLCTSPRVPPLKASRAVPGVQKSVGRGEGLQGQIAKDVHQTQKAFQARMPFFFHLSLTFFVGRSDGKPMLHLLQKHHPARLNLFGGSSRVVAQIVPMISLCNGT